MKSIKLICSLAIAPMLLLQISTTAVADVYQPQACWGQASKVFAMTGEMGIHASQQPTPRLGLANLANALYEDGVIADASLQALGQFVASELGLNIDACGT